MNLRSEKSAFLLLYIQKGFLDETFCSGNRNNKNAVPICSELPKKWHELPLPVIPIGHSSKNLQSKLYHTDAGFNLNELAAPLPDEIGISKEINTDFISTNLKNTPDNQQIDTFAISGISKNHYVSTTTQMAINYECSISLVADTCTCFDLTEVDKKHYDLQLIHKIAVATPSQQVCYHIPN